MDLSRTNFRASEILRLSEFLDRILSTGSLSYALNINGYSKKEEILELKRFHLSVEEMEDDINRAYKKIENTYNRLESDSYEDKKTLKFLDDFMQEVIQASLEKEFSE